MTGLALTLILAVNTALPAPTGLRAAPPKNDDGTHILVSWAEAEGATAYVVYRTLDAPGIAERAPSPDQNEQVWKKIGQTLAGTTSYLDEVPNPDVSYRYAVRILSGDIDAEDPTLGAAAVTDPVSTETAWFDTRRVFILLVVLVLLALLGYFYDRARRQPKAMYIRRIPGIDAIDEAIGRATEMGRPVLYVPGIDEIQNIQTIASVLILGHVAEMTARYDSEIKVPCCIPLVMVVAEETVRQGYYNAGRPDAHKPQNIRFISSEQFAFAAGTNGIILRDKPAANIYLGRFFAESLIFAETGFVNKSIQIAGTAEITQLPFFIAACDYTLIGEELYAVSAYLSRDPRLLSTLKAADYVKAGLMVLLLVGAVVAAFTGANTVGNWILP